MTRKRFQEGYKPNPKDPYELRDWENYFRHKDEPSWLFKLCMILVPALPIIYGSLDSDLTVLKKILEIIDNLPK